MVLVTFGYSFYALNKGVNEGYKMMVIHYTDPLEESDMEYVLSLYVNGATLNGQRVYLVLEARPATSGVSKDYVDGKLTELSAEVSGLSERVDALGEGAEQEVFWATEGITDASKGTTYDEILAAHNAGKVVKCLYQKIIFDLRYVTNILYFAANVNNNLYYLKCPQSNKWQYSTENTEHKLETLDNGNAKITIAGKTAEVASGTPSGDPMHYMFEAVGATYNATDEDIPMVGIYGDSYVHKARHWHLNELGDITNEEMKYIYLYKYAILSVAALSAYWQMNEKSRTALSMARANIAAHSEQYTYMQSRVETIFHQNTNKGYGILVNNMNSISRGNPKLTKVLNFIDCQYITSASNMDRPFIGCKALQEVRIKTLKYAISFQDSPLLSNASILYMIQNEAATSAIVITLHADAYDRAMADTEITAALEAHPNVSLASA